MVEKRYGIKDNEARAFLRMIKGSPQKLNLVAQSIRGLSASKAVEQLTFSKKRVAIDIKKLVLSAVSNAEHNYKLDIDKLYIKQFIFKRFRMIFPLEELVKFQDNIYEITAAASRRAYQLSMVKDPIIEENDDKVVSLAASQLFKDEVEYRIEN